MVVSLQTKQNMNTIISYQQLAWIASVEFVTLLLLTVLIAKRKIGRPLTAAEVQERKVKREQRKMEKERRRQARIQEWQERELAMAQQDDAIRTLVRPVKFVSLSGNGLDGEITICVQDGTGQPHTFHLNEMYLRKCPFFNSLLNVSKEPHYHSKRGAILFE